MNILQRSYISKFEGSDLVATFSVLSEDGKILHADGELHYVTMDLQKLRPMRVPDWLEEQLFA